MHYVAKYILKFRKPIILDGIPTYYVGPFPSMEAASDFFDKHYSAVPNSETAVLHALMVPTE